MEIKTLAHCGLVIRDLGKSRWFYGTVLGLEEVPRPKNFKFRGAWFRGGRSELHLILANDTVAPPGFPDAGSAVQTGLATHIAFEVPDLAAVQARLEQHGVELGPWNECHLHRPASHKSRRAHWKAGRLRRSRQVRSQ